MLTNSVIGGAKATGKRYCLYDERGMYLEVSPTGNKWFRLKYRFAGKEVRVSLGVYPEVSLKQARDLRDEMRLMLRQGRDPQDMKRKVSGELSFEAVAREWLRKKAATWADSYSNLLLRRLEQYVFPWIGSSSIADITAPQLLRMVRKIEERGTVETAHRVLAVCGQIFRFGVATGRVDRDPSRDLRGALQTVRHKHFAAVTEPTEVGKLMRAIYGYQGTPTVEAALKLAPIFFVRPIDLRFMRWNDLDLKAATWSFVARKTGEALVVPLPSQAIKVLEDLRRFTGRSEFVFPSERTIKAPMSNNAILGALRRMGIPKDQMCGHGFRAMARTLLDEQLGFAPHLIEHQLGHRVKDPLGRSYNRTKHLPERKEMMRRWANYLDRLRLQINPSSSAARSGE